jgi:peroxiredoxin (alkyl hydroperoxide reductase subunit C)
MGGGELWFPVLSDFYPHGAVAEKYGILRSDGVSERALFVIDKKGIIRYIDVHDINDRPRLEVLVGELQKLEK